MSARNERGEAAFAAVIAVVVVAFAVCLVFVVKAQHAWESDCKAKGGHVDSATTTGTGVGVGSNGKTGVVTTNSTTYYCLSDDGRVLGVN